MNSFCKTGCALLALLAQATPATEAVNVVSSADYPEGAIVLADGLYYAEMTRDRVIRIDGKGKTVFWSEVGCGPTSISPLEGQRLLVTCHLGGRLAVVNSTGRLSGHISQATDGSAISWPNDSHADSHGGVYLSSSGIFSPLAPATGRVLYVHRNLTVQVAASGIRYSNGVALEDEKTLLVSEHLGRRVLRYRIEQPGTLRPLPPFFEFPPIERGDPAISGPDGIEVDPRGSVYVCEYGRGLLWVFDKKGKVLSTKRLPTPFLTSSALDPERHLLYLTGSFDNTTFPYVGQVMSLPQ